MIHVKKMAVNVLIAIMIFGSFSLTSHSSDSQQKNGDSVFPLVGITLNGKCNDDCKEGYNINGTTYVPLRYIVETLGGTLEWDKETKEINITKTVFKPAGESLEIEYSDGNERNYGEDEEFMQEMEDVEVMIEGIIQSLQIANQQYSLALEYYEETNDYSWIKNFSNGRMNSLKKEYDETNVLFNEFHGKYLRKFEVMDVVYDIIFTLQSAINDLKNSVDAYERYITDNQQQEYHVYAYNRKAVLDKLEEVNMHLVEIKRFKP